MSKRIVRDATVADNNTIVPTTTAALMEPPLIIPKIIAPINGAAAGNGTKPQRVTRKLRPLPSATQQSHFHAHGQDEHASNHQAELFYLQKQIQLQTQMVFILEDGARVQGVVEWYDRNSIKIRGKSRILIYKTAIKYLFKAGEVGTGAHE
jgi:sRNA-binding regulator protein Hfq